MNEYICIVIITPDNVYPYCIAFEDKKEAIKYAIDVYIELYSKELDLHDYSNE